MNRESLVSTLKQYVTAENAAKIEEILFDLSLFFGTDNAEEIFFNIHRQFPEIHDEVVRQLRADKEILDAPISLMLF